MKGRTPLSWAAGNGHEEVVRALLERSNVNPNATDKGGRTPLLFSAHYGHEGVVRILLERNGVVASTASSRGQTLLLQATRNGYEGIVSEDAARTERRQSQHTRLER